MSIVVRDLTGLGEWSAASALYRSVFGYDQAEFGISPRLLAALRENAGSVLGAFDGGELVGFCYGFSAVEAGELYHYSQAAVVAPSAQGTGVGRRLKQAQAETARATGARTMRWTFDPYALRNAHFNFTVLGATAIRFLPDYYDDGASDRLLVSWDLAAPHATKHECTTVTTPANDTTAAPDPTDRAALRRDLIEQFKTAHLVRVERHPNQATYTFERTTR
jgi:predicted GNAT superfamily acetyltransferase